MLGKIKRSIFRIKKAAGVELTIRPDDSWVCTVTLVQLEKGVAVVHDRYEDVGSVQGLSDKIPADVPVFLCINGKGALIKKISGYQPDQPVNLHEIIPNAKPADFYCQSGVAAAGGFVALLRKQLLDQIISAFSEAGLFIHEVYIGPLVLNKLLPLFQHDDLIHAGAYRLGVAGDQIEEISSNGNGAVGQTVFRIGEDQFKNNELIAYASALSPFLNHYHIIEQDDSPVAAVREDWEQKQLFKKLGVAALAFFFMILLINALLFMQANQKNQALTGELQRSSAMLAELEGLKKDVEERSAFIEDIGWLKPSGLAFFSDQLAQSVPGAIKLTEMVLHPLDQATLESQKKYYFQNDRISIQGKCKDPVLLNNWLRTLEGLAWVAKIEDQEYRFNNQENTGVFKFVIIVIN